MPPESTFYPRVFASVTALLLGMALLRILQPFVGPVLWASLLAFLLSPVQARLCRRFRGRATPAALLLTLAVVVIIVVPAVLLAGVFVAQTSDLIGHLQTRAAQYRIEQPSDVLHLPAVDYVIKRLGAWLPMTAQQVQESVLKGGQQLLQTLVGVAGSLFAGLFGVVVAVVIALFLFFFFVRDGEQIITRTMALVPLDDRRKEHLLAHLSNVIRAIVLGSLATAVAQGALVGVGFAIVGLPSPIVFAVLAMGASIVPLVGTTIIWLPAVLWLLLGGHWGSAVFLAVWGVAVVSGADNVIRPLFITSRAKITTLPVFIGLMGGIGAFGTIGIFLGPVIIALALALFAFAEEARAEAKQALWLANK